MKNKIKMDIEFWDTDTEKTFLKAKETLMDDCGYSEENANSFLEMLYYAVASEYGDQECKKCKNGRI